MNRVVWRRNLGYSSENMRVPHRQLLSSSLRSAVPWKKMVLEWTPPHLEPRPVLLTHSV